VLIARWKSEANFRRREALYDLSGRVWGCNNILLFSVGVWDGTALCLFGIMSKFIRSQKDFVHIWVLWTMYDAEGCYSTVWDVEFQSLLASHLYSRALQLSLATHFLLVSIVQRLYERALFCTSINYRSVRNYRVTGTVSCRSSCCSEGSSTLRVSASHK
jgi:hypothetical protein